MEVTHMGLRDFLLHFLVLCSVLLSYNGVESRKLSKEEHLELDKQLKLINKPAVKIIKTIYGDTYGCVDFYKQPAFDHPSLKNHTFHFQMKPTSYPEGRGNEQSTTVDKSFRKIWRNGKGCPSGTVPIRRVTRDELVSAKSFTQAYASKTNPLAADTYVHHFAVVRTKDSAGRKYHGAGMVSGVYNPQVGFSQFSSARMTIGNSLTEFIQVGWIVNPELYKDSRTRLFTFKNMGGSQCFNALCPGIVSVSKDIPLDHAFSKVGVPGGPTYITKFFVYRDAADGKWWLEFGPSNTRIGFWPPETIPGLKDYATFIDWGGEVFSPSEEPSPPMGDGDFPGNGDKSDAYCSHLLTVDENNKAVEADSTEEIADNVDGYKVNDKGHKKNFDHLIFYGGPGGLKG